MHWYTKILGKENPYPRIYSPLSCVTSRSKVSVLSSVPDCSLGISQSFKGKQHILFPQHSYRNGHRLRKLDSKAVQWHVITYNYKRNIFFLFSLPTCVLICMNERGRGGCVLRKPSVNVYSTIRILKTNIELARIVIYAARSLTKLYWKIRFLLPSKEAYFSLKWWIC